MRIASLTIIHNPILGSILLDFSNESGSPFDTIILAGENGCGKTIILNMLFEFSQFEPKLLTKTERREFRIVLNEEELKFFNENPYRNNYAPNGIGDRILNIKFDGSREGWGQVSVSFVDLDGKTIEAPGGSFSHEPIRQKFNAIYSDVEINFTPRDISNVTSEGLDRDVRGSVRSQGDLATQIAQLLVDIQATDDAEFAQWAREHPGHTVDISKIDIRVERFKEAFRTMFSTKEYVGVRTTEGRKLVVFREHGHEVSLESLSSGEKQIVFRGGFLLRDSKSLAGRIVLVDEPEISLHPAWQLRILDFYKRLFVDEQGDQKSQIFVATHSPFVIHNDSRVNDKVIVLTKDKEGKILVSGENTFFGWTDEKLISEAFNIEFGKKPDKRLVFVEGETDIKYILRAAELFSNMDVLAGIDLIQAGGSGKLNKVWNVFSEHLDHKMGPVLLIYDCETGKPDEQKGGIFRKTIPTKETHPVHKGIENLFPKDLISRAISFRKEFIDVVGPIKKRIRGKEIVEPEALVVNEDEKMNLCNWICANATKKDFEAFESLFGIIEGFRKKADLSK